MHKSSRFSGFILNFKQISDSTREMSDIIGLFFFIRAKHHRDHLDNGMGCLSLVELTNALQTVLTAAEYSILRLYKKIVAIKFFSNWLYFELLHSNFSNIK